MYDMLHVVYHISCALCFILLHVYMLYVMFCVVAYREDEEEQLLSAAQAALLRRRQPRGGETAGRCAGLPYSYLHTLYFITNVTFLHVFCTLFNAHVL